MTKEELLALVQGNLKEDVAEDVITKLDTGLTEVVNDQIQGVIKSKEKILGEKKTLQAQFEEMNNKYKYFVENEIDPAKYQDLAQKLELAQTASSTPEEIKELQQKFYEQGQKTKEQELNPKLEALQSQIDQITGQFQAKDQKYRDTLKQNALNGALNKLGIQADNFWLSGFYASADAEYIETEDRIDIQMPNPIDPNSPKIPLSDWVKMFPGTDEGKRLIPAPRNGGAGASGSNGTPGKTQSLAGKIGSMFGGK